MSEHLPVVVGLDGSAAADAALQWALRRARTSGTRVRVVAVGCTPDADALREAAGADVEVRLEAGRSAHVLLAASAGASLLVVGRRGAGRVRGLLGSTASAVLRGARCPVAVVPQQPSAGTGPVVVGWDGSAGAERAVAWAAQEAAASGRPLEVVVGWQVTSLHAALLRDGTAALGVVPPREAYERVARSAATAGAALATAVVAGRPLEVAPRTVHRPAARALLASAEHASLLVVGARGAGGFPGLALGSTSDQVARHAACPVVVVRDAGDPREDEEHGPATTA